MRKTAVTFLGFNLKVWETAYAPNKPKREMIMSYPNPQKLQKAMVGI